MNPSHLKLRPGRVDDLDECNKVVEAAVLSWDLPDRVKRLSLSSYLYNPHDLDHLDLRVAEESFRGIVGVATWEALPPSQVLEGKHALLLHGIYVAADRQHSGIGTRLIAAAADAARAGGFDGLLVKAKSSANGFFVASGLTSLQVTDPERDYPHRFWLPM